MPKKRAPKPKPKPKQTAAITAAPPTLVKQPHGGALLTGGVLGNKGGRPPDEFKAMMRRMVSRDRTIAALGMILKRPDHQHWPAAFKMAKQGGYPELEPLLKGVGGGTGSLTINFNFIAEGRRYAEPAEVVSKPNGSGNGSNGHG
jgi:hypothetical protein